VRMQEEIGTGGAGFRFMYASFLQESRTLLGDPALNDMATQLTRIGDDWRQFASACVRQSRNKQGDGDFNAIAGMLEGIAVQERELVRRLAGWAKRR